MEKMMRRYIILYCDQQSNSALSEWTIRRLHSRKYAIFLHIVVGLVVHLQYLALLTLLCGQQITTRRICTVLIYDLGKL